MTKPPAKLTGKRALTFRRSIAASLRGCALDLHIGTIDRAEYDRRLAEHQKGLTDRGLRPLTAEERRNPSSITG